jgi:hypothetical protein
MRLHLLMCSACRLYLRQIRRIGNRASTSYIEQTPSREDLDRLEREILGQLFSQPGRPTLVGPDGRFSGGGR